MSICLSEGQSTKSDLRIRGAELGKAKRRPWSIADSEDEEVQPTKRALTMDIDDSDDELPKAGRYNSH